MECSGRVVKSGGGLMAWRVDGLRVATTCGSSDRMWAEYAVAPALNCMPVRPPPVRVTAAALSVSVCGPAEQLPDDVSFEEGSSCFVNPLTALAMFDVVAGHGASAIVQTVGLPVV